MPKVQPQRLQHASWLGNTTTLILVAGNDIYLKPSPADDDDDIRLTNNGQQDTVYNGVTDWLYQGEYLLVSINL